MDVPENFILMLEIAEKLIEKCHCDIFVPSLEARPLGERCVCVAWAHTHTKKGKHFPPFSKFEARLAIICQRDKSTPTTTWLIAKLIKRQIRKMHVKNWHSKRGERNKTAEVYTKLW